MIAGWHEQSEAEVPAHNEWLGPPELARLEAFRFVKRRTEWRLGRWTAKRAVAGYLGLPATSATLRGFEIRPAPSGAPEVFSTEGQVGVTISLSHRAGRAVCSVAPSPGALGCDLEVIEPHSGAFIADFFTLEEQQWVAGTAEADRPTLLTLLWSAKESALKALHAGLRLDTRSLIVAVGDPLRLREEDGDGCGQREDGHYPGLTAPQPGTLHRWHPLRVHHVKDQTFLGWWQQTGKLLRTMVAAPPPARPLLLSISRVTSSSRCVARSNASQAA